jgi:hypothetical protein
MPIAAGLLLLALQACTALSSIAGCSVEWADERGGYVTHVTQFTEVGAVKLAAAYCAQYGRAAQPVGIDWGETRLEFACVPAPPRALSG